jgi:hypothetical protein
LQSNWQFASVDLPSAVAGSSSVYIQVAFVTKVVVPAPPLKAIGFGFDGKSTQQTEAKQEKKKLPALGRR